MIRQKIEQLKTQMPIEMRLTQIKQVCVRLLKAFSDVCTKHNLKWWIDGGTLLGTVRNGKIIDWDDDVDVVMLRDDYTKLVKLAEKNPYVFGQNYFFQTAKTDNYLETFAKLRDNNSTALTPREFSMSHNRGMFIDIFPLDNAPELLYTLDDIGGFVRTVAKHSGQDRKLVDKEQAWSTLNRVLSQIDAQNVDSDYLMNAAFLRYTRDCLLLKKSWYDKTIMMMFENILVPVPHKMEQVLEAWYGPSWQTPTKTVFYGYVDPFTPYKEYDSLTKDEFEYLIK